jgi:hypothetical protein
MHEVIVTHLVPASDTEPEHTVIYRWDFDDSTETSIVIGQAIENLNWQSVSGGRMTNG